MKIIFDFDYTVFNMSLMHEELVAAMEQLGIQQQEFIDAYNIVTYWKMFTLESMARRLKRAYDVSEEVVISAFNRVLQQSELFVYEDFHPCQQELKNNGHQLYLLTWGDQDWQSKKIEYSKISNYFDDIITASSTKVEALENWKEIAAKTVFVNDKPAEIRSVREVFPDFRYIRLRRVDGKFSDQDTPPGVDEAIDLKDVVKLIQSQSPKYVRHNRL